MTKIKNIFSGVVSVIAMAPAIASAQFQEPTGTGLPAGSLLGIITSAMNWLLIVVGILGVIGFVIAGIIYLTAAGDEGQIDRGKRTMINSIIGIVVALLGVIVIQAVKAFLGGNNAKF